jgi:hypothetical protein
VNNNVFVHHVRSVYSVWVCFSLRPIEKRQGKTENQTPFSSVFRAQVDVERGLQQQHGASDYLDFSAVEEQIDQCYCSSAAAASEASCLAGEVVDETSRAPGICRYILRTPSVLINKSIYSLDFPKKMLPLLWRERKAIRDSEEISCYRERGRERKAATKRK